MRTAHGGLQVQLVIEWLRVGLWVKLELGVGLNPKAKIGRGVELEDEGEFGTLHLGIGNGITFGSSIRAVGHVDLVVRHPIVEVDGKIVLKDREVLA